MDQQNSIKNKYYYAIFLCLFLGMFGIHRFYTGYKKVGLIQLFLLISVIGLPISFVWALFDLITIINKKYKTKDGIYLTDYSDYHNKAEIYVSAFYENEDADILLKKATELKSSDINKSIDLLKQAYIEISKTSTNYSIETFLRLPLYLQAAHRSEEAIIEFNNLLENGYPNQLKLKDIIPMEHSRIYDKMRLFYQREKQNEKAISYGLYSILLDCLGLYLQKRIKELEANKNIIFIKQRITPLLKKAKKIENLDKISNILLDEINKLPNICSFEELSAIVENNIGNNDKTNLK